MPQREYVKLPRAEILTFAEIARSIAAVWSRRRGAEERLTRSDRSPLLPAAELRRDPHLEMHTRGG